MFKDGLESKFYKPDDALHIFGSKLTSFEITEIEKYRQVI